MVGTPKSLVNPWSKAGRSWYLEAESRNPLFPVADKTRPTGHYYE